MPIPLAAGGADILFAVAIAVIIIGLIASYYSRRGSDIAQRPIGGEQGGQPGVGEGQSRMSASDHDAEDTAEGPRN